MKQLTINDIESFLCKRPNPNLLSFSTDKPSEIFFLNLIFNSFYFFTFLLYPRLRQEETCHIKNPSGRSEPTRSPPSTLTSMMKDLRWADRTTRP